MHPTQDPATTGVATLTGRLDATATEAETLSAAAAYLASHGWHQGDMFADPDQPTPAACALGAIRMVVFGTPVVDATVFVPERLDAYDHAAERLADHLVLFGYVDRDPSSGRDDPTDLVGDWNDAPERNLAQVLAVLHGAASEWERLHPQHIDDPHRPGTDSGCPVCAIACYCAAGFQCVHCASVAGATWSIPGGVA